MLVGQGHDEAVELALRQHLAKRRQTRAAVSRLVGAGEAVGDRGDGGAELIGERAVVELRRQNVERDRAAGRLRRGGDAVDARADFLGRQIDAGRLHLAHQHRQRVIQIFRFHPARSFPGTM